MKRACFLLVLVCTAVFLNAQSNPVPFIGELLPTSTAPGGSAFTLTVNGGNFVSSSAILWNGSALTTHFVSQARLTATVPATDIAKASTASVSVRNSGAPASNVSFFSVTNPVASVAFTGYSILTDGVPQSLVTADFDGDGILDIAVPNNTVADSMAVLLGKGDGSFQPYTTYPAAYPPLTAATGDFNGDGIIDLVAADFIDGYASVLLGNGDGTFRTPLSSPTSSNLFWIVAGDFNRDGKLDLVVSAEGELSILLGNGDGTFQPQTSIYSGIGYGCVAADFNGDGILDLAMTHLNNLLIFIGNGDGTFQPYQQYAVSPSDLNLGLAVGDLNGDGILDLAVPDVNGVYILLGNPGGTFSAPTLVSMPPSDYTLGENRRHER